MLCLSYFGLSKKFFQLKVCATFLCLLNSDFKSNEPTLNKNCYRWTHLRINRQDGQMDRKIYGTEFIGFIGSSGKDGGSKCEKSIKPRLLNQ